MAVRCWVSGGTAAAIAASVEDGLGRGRAAAGDPLPTVRQLASVLNVSPATVAAAYKTLRQRGLISGHGRRGTRVTRAPAPATSHADEPSHSTARNLASGNPDPSLLPPLDAALRVISTAHRLYDGAPLVRPFATFAAGEFAADGIDSRFTAVVSGALDGIERILREHLRPGDRVAVEDPSFPGLLHLLKASGFAVEPFGLDDEGPLPAHLGAALRRRCHAIVISPRAQNPTGAALTERRARELHRVLRGYPDVVLIENDDAAPVAGAPAITLTKAARHWAVIRSTSKFLGPDLRVAVMTGDERTIARVQGRHALGARWVSGILQELALAMWSDPSSARHLARVAEIYRQRRTALVGALAARGIAAHGRSGLNVWIPAREESAVVQALERRGWAVAPGERFRIASAPGVRVTTAALAPPDTERLADEIAEAMRGSPRRSA